MKSLISSNRTSWNEAPRGKSRGILKGRTYPIATKLWGIRTELHSMVESGGISEGERGGCFSRDLTESLPCHRVADSIIYTVSDTIF